MNHSILKARHTQATQKRLAKGGQSYRFRLNAIAVTGQRKGKFWK